MVDGQQQVGVTGEEEGEGQQQVGVKGRGGDAAINAL
jgi:hypothetical protein